MSRYKDNEALIASSGPYLLIIWDVSYNIYPENSKMPNVHKISWENNEVKNNDMNIMNNKDTLPTNNPCSRNVKSFFDIWQYVVNEPNINMVVPKAITTVIGFSLLE